MSANACLVAHAESMRSGDGTWQIRLHRGVPTLEFQILADAYGPARGGDATSSVGATSVAPFIGSFKLVGSAPLLHDTKKGTANFVPPDPRSQAFAGTATFTAEQIDALPVVQSTNPN